MNYYTLKIFYITFIFSVLFPFATIASEIRLETDKVEVRTGEPFTVHVTMSADEPINAINGRLIFPQDTLSVKEIREGNSVINFWMEKPHLESSGVMLFSGITPGGFHGTNNNIFSVVFEAKSTGLVSIILQNMKVLKNDGLGTEAVFSTRDASVSIKEGDSRVFTETITDVNLPEDFTPIIENNLNIFDGKYFLVFQTQDKISGIDRYEIREGKWGWFKNAESPYLLKNQSLNKKIFIKAIDKSGNERIVTVSAQKDMPWYQQYAVIGILLIVILIGLLFKKL